MSIDNRGRYFSRATTGAPNKSNNIVITAKIASASEKSPEFIINLLHKHTICQ